MGQAASKVASKSRVAASRKSAAVADPITGFTRGKGPMIRQEAQQQAFLQQQQHKDNSTRPPQQDMPDDLIRFLNDVGPLQEKRKSDSKPEKRPPRLPRHLLPSEQQQQEQEPSTSQAAAVDKTRHQHAMPLAEKIEGFDTMRTTSFSNRQDVHDSVDFGLEILDFYKLLASSSKDDTKAVDRFYQSYASKLKAEDETLNWTPKQSEEHRSLIQQSLQALQLPIVMKETDDTYVGVWPDKVNDYKLLKLRETSKAQVKLVLEDLVEIENAKSIDTSTSKSA